MTTQPPTKVPPMNKDEERITQQLIHLRLPFIRENYQSLAQEAARQQWGARSI
jgi:hypothetical protein